jgi:hypothetical protein
VIVKIPADARKVVPHSDSDGREMFPVTDSGKHQ